MFGACRQKRTGHCVVPGGNWEYCCIYFLLDYIHLLGIPYYLVRCSAELSSTAAPLRQQSLDRRWQHGSDSSVHAVLLQSWSMQLFTMERIVETFCPQTLELSLLILSHVEHSVRNWKIWRTFTLCCCLKFENGKRLEALIQNFFLFFSDSGNIFNCFCLIVNIFLVLFSFSVTSASLFSSCINRLAEQWNYETALSYFVFTKFSWLKWHKPWMLHTPRYRTTGFTWFFSQCCHK